MESVKTGLLRKPLEDTRGTASFDIFISFIFWFLTFKLHPLSWWSKSVMSVFSDLMLPCQLDTENLSFNVTVGFNEPQ